MKKLLPLVFALVTLLSCDNDEKVDCSTVLCAGPSVLALEILQNGENIFDNGVSAEDISFLGNFPEGYELQIEVSNYNGGTKLLFVQQIDWEVGTYNFRLAVDSVESPPLSLTIALSTGDCCGGIPQVSQFEVDGVALANPQVVSTIILE